MPRKIGDGKLTSIDLDLVEVSLQHLVRIAFALARSAMPEYMPGLRAESSAGDDVGVTESPDTELKFIERQIVLFGEGRYDWIDVKRFELGTDTDPREALRLLIGHVRFRDHYSTATSHAEDSVDIHGPYWLAHVEPDSFERVDTSDVLEGLRGFARRYSTVEEAKSRLAAVEDQVEPLIAGASVCFRLRELGAETQHEFGWVLDDFVEFVVFQPEQAQILLIVAAED